MLAITSLWRAYAGDVTAIALKFSNMKFLGWQQRRYAGADLKSLSDQALEDIGFRLGRRDLNAVKPFWMA